MAITSDGLVYTWGKTQGPSTAPDGQPHRLAEGALGFAGDTTDHARAGRWHKENRARTVAFAMDTHVGLANNADTGGTTPYSADFPEELLRDMFHRMRFAVREGSGDGVQLMLGVETARRSPW